MIVSPGSVDVITYFMMRLAADGTAATGLTPANFDLQYTRSGEAAAAKVDATLNGNGVDGDHSDNTVIEVNATSSPGLYRVDWPDAAFAAGVPEVICTVKVATAFAEPLRVTLQHVLESADSGATSVAREGEDGSTHTLKTLSSQIGGISGGGSAQNEDAESVVLTTGTQTTGTFTATHEIDGIYHGVTNVAGTINYYYVVNIGANGSPAEVSINGRLDEGSPPSGDDTVDIIAYNNDTMSFEVVRVDAFLGVNGSTSANDTTESATLKAKHVNTAGEVWVGIQRNGGSLESGTEMLIDQLNVAFTQVGTTTGYANGAVWISAAGEAGSVPDVNGVADKPVDNLPDALTIAGLKNLVKFEVAAKTALQFVEASMDGYEFYGRNYTIDFNGKTTDSLIVSGATVSGHMNATGPFGLVECRLSDGCTLPNGGYGFCTMPGDITLDGTFYGFLDCKSLVAGGGYPMFTVTDGDNIELNFRGHSGGIGLAGLEAGATVSIEGHGQIVIDASCTGGTIAVRGHWPVSGDAAAIASITWLETARFEVEQITGGAYPLDTDGNGRIRIVDGIGTGEINTNNGAIALVDLVTTTTTNTDMRGTDSANVVVPDVAGTAAGLHSTTDGLVSAVGVIVSSTETKLDALIVTVGVAGAGLADLGGMSTGMKEDVNAECDTALADYDGPTNTEMTAAFTEIKGATWDATNSLEAIRDRGDAAWITATSVTVSDKTGFSLAAAGLDSIVIETGLNARQALSVAVASAAGKVSGAATTTVVILGAGVETTRITATVDANGNRSAVTLAPPV